MHAQATTAAETGDGDAPDVHAPGFVGRAAEIATLARAMEEHPSVVLVEGEAGIGKTRLVWEFFASAATDARHRVSVATCPPFREHLTLGAVVDAVRNVRPTVPTLAGGQAWRRPCG